MRGGTGWSTAFFFDSMGSIKEVEVLGFHCFSQFGAVGVVVLAVCFDKFSPCASGWPGPHYIAVVDFCYTVLNITRSDLVM